MRSGSSYRLLALALMTLAWPHTTQARSADTVARLDWMIGNWVQEAAAGTVRETWETAGPGTLSGIGRTERPGRPVFEERMTIQATSGGATFTAKLPGQPPTSFALQSHQSGMVVFENKAHDFPQRVIYRRCGRDLCARIEGVIGGKAAAESWRYKRVRSS